MKKPTLAEREAVAMLLGRWYDWTDNSMNRSGSINMLDADTLEPLAVDTSQHRMQHYGTEPDGDISMERVTIEVPWVEMSDEADPIGT